MLLKHKKDVSDQAKLAKQQKAEQESLREQQIEAQEKIYESKMKKRRKQLLAYASTTPIPQIVKHAKRALWARVETSFDINFDDPTKDAIEYKISWDHKREERIYQVIEESYLWVSITLNVNGDASFDSQLRYGQEGLALDIVPKELWMRNPVLLTEVAFKMIQNCYHESHTLDYRGDGGGYMMR